MKAGGSILRYWVSAFLAFGLFFGVLGGSALAEEAPQAEEDEWEEVDEIPLAEINRRLENPPPDHPGDSEPVQMTIEPR